MGRFITFEGGEAAGKSTQIARLADSLRARAIPVLLTREPGGAPGAERLRALLLDPAAAWSPLADTLLHFAARAEHAAKTIRPALDAGAWVLCDRFFDSTRAYQGSGQGVAAETIETLIRLIGLVPDCTLILDIDAETAARRLAARGDAPDRYERFDASFHARVAQAYRAIAAAEPQRCALIDAAAPPDTVSGAILAALRQRFPELGLTPG